MNKCYCNADFSAEDLKNIIKNVREKSNVVAQNNSRVLRAKQKRLYPV